MEGDGIRCFNKLFRALIVVVILLPCVVNPSPSLGFKNISSGGVMRCIEREREALLAFKQGLVDHNNLLSSWGIEEHKQDCCKWAGVHCSNRTNHVTELHLGWADLDHAYAQKGHPDELPYYLQGMMSPKLIELQHLRYLDLSRIQFNGRQIPDFIGSLSNLRYLDLTGTYSGGRFPIQVGNLTHLQYLDLSFNHFVFEGGIPPSFSGLCNLQVFLLYNNTLDVQLSSLVQMLISACPNHNSLETLDLSSNHLSGSIPYLTNFSSLETLCLENNRLSGTVSESIGHLSRLETLYLGSNAFEGVVSESLFSNLSRLRELEISYTSLNLSFSSNWTPPFQLYGLYISSSMVGPQFPKWLQTQKSYQYLEMYSAGISDTIPSWFWSPLSHQDHDFIYIDLSNNKIRGTIPNSRFEFPSPCYSQLNLSWNQLEGPVPSFLSNATSLDLSNNKLSGLSSFMCPKTPNKVSRLAVLDLSSNNLHEQLPNCWTRFEYLASLDLSDNALFGKIPTTIISLPSIKSLKLNKNGFGGELPSSLKNLSRLHVFDVGENNLLGLIPEWLGVGLPNLTILILRSNHFYGSIPLQLCNMRAIQILDISMNNISGNIPKCVNNLTNLALRGSPSLTILQTYNNFISGQDGYFEEESLIWKGIMSKYKNILGLVKCIHLSSNRLTGEIPMEITDLVGLVSLNLSRNNLTGQITPTIGKLKSLESLDLSRNHIYGGIPRSIFQIYGLGDLDLSNNNLSGQIPMGTQLQNYDQSAFSGNPLLCGIPLKQLCSSKETSLEQQPVFVDQVEDKDELITTGFYWSLALGFVVGFWGVCGSLIFIESWSYTYYNFLNSVHDWLYLRVALRRRRTIHG